MTNFKKNWCNKLVAAIVPASENGVNEQESISEITKSVSQVILDILNKDIG